MRIEYKNSFWDFLNFYLVTRFLSPVIQGFLVLCSLYIYVSDVAEKGVGEAIFFAIFYYIFYWLFLVVITVFESFLKSSSKYNYRHIIELQNDIFYEETAINRSYFKFEGIYKIVFAARVSVVYVAPNAGFFVPNNCFKSPQEKSEFFNTLKLKVSNAKAT